MPTMDRQPNRSTLISLHDGRSSMKSILILMVLAGSVQAETHFSSSHPVVSLNRLLDWCERSAVENSRGLTNYKLKRLEQALRRELQRFPNAKAQITLTADYLYINVVAPEFRVYAWASDGRLIDSSRARPNPSLKIGVRRDSTDTSPLTP